MLHGGDTLSYEKYYDGELIDFSSNINPLGPPEGLNEKLIEGFTTLTAYPDIEYRDLKKSIKDYLNCKYENVIVGNGAVEIIDYFSMFGNRIITTTPAFAEYSLRSRVHKKEVVEIPYREDFSLDLAAFEGEIKKGDTIMVGNPNNPTGLRIDKDELLNLYSIVKKRDAYLVLDEAFFEFAPADYDSIELFREDGYKNVAIIRAATKFFGLPGIRLGYACASEEKVDEIKTVELPWSINAMADIAGQYIFENVEYIERSVEYISEERSFLLGELDRFKFIKAFKTHTNYILIELKEYDEDFFFDYFLKHGIVIRKCSSFKSLGNRYIRIAIKDRENNKKIIKIFEAFEKDNIR